jgi:hypothetical protein
MPKKEPIAKVRSQSLTFASGDMVTLDRKTLQEILKLTGKSIDALQNVRHCEILISSLDHHLSEIGNPELARYHDDINKALLLVQYWLGFAPDNHRDIDKWLNQAIESMQVVLAASELGGNNE